MLRRTNKLEKREFTKSRLLRQKNTAIIVPIAHVARACKWWGLFGSKSEQKITRSRISPLLSFASIRYYVIPRTVISSLYTDVIKLIVDTITRCTFSFRELLFSYIIHVMYIYIYWYRGLINYNINIHNSYSISRVQRVNPSSGNTGIAYIRHGKLFLETSPAHRILSSFIPVYLYI